MLIDVMPCYAMLCYVMLCYAMLCYRGIGDEAGIARVCGSEKKE